MTEKYLKLHKSTISGLILTKLLVDKIVICRQTIIRLQLQKFYKFQPKKESSNELDKIIYSREILARFSSTTAIELETAVVKLDTVESFVPVESASFCGLGSVDCIVRRSELVLLSEAGEW